MELENLNKTKLFKKFKEIYPTESWKSLGFYTDEYLDHIPPHWLAFKPEKGYVYDILAIIYAVMAIFGLAANAFTIYMIVSCESLRTPSNYLIGNLAMADFLMMAKVPIFIINSIYRGPVLGYFGCQIYGFLGGFSGTLSIITLAAISVDRYYAIVRPLLHTKFLNSKGMLLVIGFIWIYAGFFSSVPLFGWFGSKYTSEGLLNTCSFDYLDKNTGNRVFIFVYFWAAWALPLVVLSFMYWRIGKVVRKAEKKKVLGRKRYRDSVRLRKGRSLRANCRRNKKTAHLGFKLTWQWFVAWTPYAVVALMGIFGFDEYLTPLSSEIPAIFCKIGSCTNPCNYFLDHPKFHVEFKSKFPRLASFFLRKEKKEKKQNEEATDPSRDTPQLRVRTVRNVESEILETEL